MEKQPESLKNIKKNSVEFIRLIFLLIVVLIFVLIKPPNTFSRPALKIKLDNIQPAAGFLENRASIHDIISRTTFLLFGKFFV